MPTPHEDVRHDVSSLYRFVDSICAFCAVQNRSPAYLPASKEFLAYVHELGEKTKRYLASFHTKLPSDSSSFNVYRQALAVLRIAWSEIHRRVKPTADADTLHLPSSLLWVFVRRLRTLSAFSDADFAVFHIEQLNYLQVVAEDIRGHAAKIASFTAAPTFPPKLGLIGIPYSQSETVFSNCLIAHEMAHFIFGEQQLRNNFAAEIMKELVTHVGPVASQLPDQTRLKWLPHILASHVEELFCDLFAIRFLGPCYSFAFIEILDLPNLLDASRKLVDISSQPYLDGSDSHPAVLFRIQRHKFLLDQLSWWDEIKGLNSHYRLVLENASTIASSKFTFTLFNPIGTSVLAAFFALVPLVEQTVKTLMGKLDGALDDYKKNKEDIRDLLLHGVVPSAVFDVNEKPSYFSTPISILNVAYMIYLDKLQELINKIENQDQDNIEDRVRWIRKLEMWTSKALEDYQLLSMRNH